MPGYSRHSEEFPFTSQRPLPDLRRVLPRDGIIVVGSGNTQGAARPHFDAGSIPDQPGGQPWRKPPGNDREATSAPRTTASPAGPGKSPDGSVRSSVTLLSRDQWEVLIRDHHSGYITGEDYMAKRVSNIYAARRSASEVVEMVRRLSPSADNATAQPPSPAALHSARTPPVPRTSEQNLVIQQRINPGQLLR
jgi:hypothetical protein